MIFFVNGKQVTTQPDREVALLDFLRDTMHLMGTKNGCGTGHCGACTVIIDGEARRACQVRLVKMDGRRIETIEGLASDGRLDPIHSLFVKTGAIQCGVCSPVMIMTRKALLDKKPNPDIQD